jgi:hypothetical protein
MEYTDKPAVPHKMVEYTIATAHNYEELIAVVSDLMKKGVDAARRSFSPFNMTAETAWE